MVVVPLGGMLGQAVAIDVEIMDSLAAYCCLTSAVIYGFAPVPALRDDLPLAQDDLRKDDVPCGPQGPRDAVCAGIFHVPVTRGKSSCPPLVTDTEPRATAHR